MAGAAKVQALSLDYRHDSHRLLRILRCTRRGTHAATCEQFGATGRTLAERIIVATRVERAFYDVGGD